jgi:hypothetical protein
MGTNETVFWMILREARVRRLLRPKLKSHLRPNFDGTVIIRTGDLWEEKKKKRKKLR